MDGSSYPCRPGEGRDPYRVIYRLEKVEVPNNVSSPNSSLWLWVPAFAGTTAWEARQSLTLIRHQHVGHEVRLTHGLPGERRALLEPGARGGRAPQCLAARIAQRPAQRLVVVIAGEIVAGVELEPVAIGVANIKEERIRDAVAAGAALDVLHEALRGHDVAE